MVCNKYVNLHWNPGSKARAKIDMMIETTMEMRKTASSGDILSLIFGFLSTIIWNGFLTDFSFQHVEAE